MKFDTWTLLNEYKVYCDRGQVGES